MSKTTTYFDWAFFGSLIFIAISFPISFKVSNWGIVSLAIVWFFELLLVKKRIQFISKRSRIIFFPFLALFLWQVATLFYTNDLESGYRNLEGKLSLLIIPIILLTRQVSFVQLVVLFKAYIYAILFCTLFLFYNSGLHYLESSRFLTYHDFTAVLGFHAVFYSYYTYLAIVISAFLLELGVLKKNERTGLLLLNVLLFVALVISASKNVLIVTTLSVLTLGFYRVIKGKFTLQRAAFILSVVAVVCSSFLISPNIRMRLSELGKFDGIENLQKVQQGEKLDHEDRIKFNGTSLRIFFWVTGIEIVAKNNSQILGLTPGDRRAIINEEYFKNGMNPAYENFNLHNQFVQTYVEMGVIGLSFYLILLTVLFSTAIKTKNLLLLIFLSAFVVFQMTESVLERNKGIVFYIFFIILLQQLRSVNYENRHNRN